jgi:hypothetical protein
MEGVWEQGAKENVWTYEGKINRKLEKIKNEDLHNLHSSPNIIRGIKCSRITWAGHIVSMGEMRNAYKVLSKNLKKEATKTYPLLNHHAITSYWEVEV